MHGCMVEGWLGSYPDPHLHRESAFKPIVVGATTMGGGRAYSIASVGSNAHTGGRIGK